MHTLRLITNEPKGERRIENVHAYELFGSGVYVIADPLYQHQLATRLWDKQEIERARISHRIEYRPAMVNHVRYRDIYWLGRALIHRGERYQLKDVGELPLLRRAEQLTRDLHGAILGLRTGNAKRLAGSVEAQIYLILAVIHPNVRDEHKRQAIQQIVATQTGQDRAGRVNPGALCARIVSALHHLAQREAAVTNIDAITAKWRQAVETTISALEFQIFIAQDFLQQALKDAPRLLANAEARDRFIDHLIVMAPVFQQHAIQPFSATFSHASREFTEAVTLLNGGQDTAALERLHTSHASFKLRRIRSLLETQLLALSRQVYHPNPAFDGTSVGKAIQEQVEELKLIDTSCMVAFHTDLVQAFLNQAVEHLHVKQYKAAHEAFASAVVLI